MERRCVITSGLTPGISAAVQANKSALSIKVWLGGKFPCASYAHHLRGVKCEGPRLVQYGLRRVEDQDRQDDLMFLCPFVSGLFLGCFPLP